MGGQRKSATPLRAIGGTASSSTWIANLSLFRRAMDCGGSSCSDPPRPRFVTGIGMPKLQIDFNQSCSQLYFDGVGLCVKENIYTVHSISGLISVYFCNIIFGISF